MLSTYHFRRMGNCSGKHDMKNTILKKAEEVERYEKQVAYRVLFLFFSLRFGGI